MNSKQQLTLKETVYNISSTLPLVFAMAVCAGAGAFAGAVFSCIAAFGLSFIDQNKKTSIFASFLILTYMFKEFGASSVSVSVMLCGIFLILTALTFNKTKSAFERLLSADIDGMVMFLAALSVTILFTTDYFGIGASGNTNYDIIQSYISLGFHPNWRGVLYGTIVMVVMITFPRKFKKFSKIISAGIIAVIITTALNYLLNPVDMISAIKETGNLSITDFKDNILISVFKSKPAVNSSIYFCALSLYYVTLLSLLQNKESKKSDAVSTGLFTVFLGGTICLPAISSLKRNKIMTGVISSVISALIFLTFHGFISKIPVHSLAVILIVGAWQSVKWSEFKKIFSSGLRILLFISNTLICLLFGFYFVPITAFISSFILSKKSDK